MALRFLTTIVFAFPVAVSTIAGEVNWPQWRGPNLNLTSSESNWNADWPESGPPIRWSTNVGIGYSSVAVVGNQLWTMGHKDGEEWLYCLAADTGKEVWTHRYAGELVDNMNRGGPGSTPTVGEDHVYSLGRQGQVCCLSKTDGRIVWSLDARSVLAVKVPEWGFTSSPVIVGDRVILDLGHIVALETNTGNIAWKTNAFKPGYGSATPFLHNGNPAIAMLNNEGLVLLKADDGAEISFYKWETSFDTNSTSPIVINNKSVFLSTGYQRGCTLLSIVDDKLTPNYENKSLSNHMANCVVHEEHIYGFDGNAHRGRTARLVCIDLASGTERWTQLGFGCGSLILANNKLVILSEKGELVIADPNPVMWQELARAKVIDERCWTVPVLAGGQVYCRNDIGDLVCVDLRTER